MTAIIKSASQNSVTIEITVPLSESMLDCEDKITEVLNEAGSLAAKTALERFDSDGTPILIGDTKWTAKGRFNKSYQTIWGEVDVKRYTYQPPKGGRQFCPLEKDARIVLTTTPGFARLVSSKYAEMGSTRVLFDLAQNHQRIIARSYLKNVCDTIGSIAQAKEESWTYALPDLSSPVSAVAVGIDGTCMLLTESGWREAMVGTLSLYDGEGKRLHTIQIGATPEYGKSTFYTRFDRELTQIRERYPNACFIGVADGAKSNWEYLKPRTDKQTVDFWHATGYLGKAAEAMFNGKRKAVLKREWLDNACHKLKHNVGAASRLLREMIGYNEENALPKIRQENLDTAITYFTNNKTRMSYARNVENNIPIGSGVTEAACKTLVKQCPCGSGMRWKNKGAKVILSLRALVQSKGRW
jgi:hypothetical protein